MLMEQVAVLETHVVVGALDPDDLHRSEVRLDLGQDAVVHPIEHRAHGPIRRGVVVAATVIIAAARSKY